MNKLVRGATLLLAVVVLVGPACTRKSGTSVAARTSLLKPYEGYLLPAAGLRPKPGAVHVTYLGSSMLLFDDGETQLLVDPFLSRPADAANASATPPDAPRIDQALKQVGAERVKALFVARGDGGARDAAYIARKTGATLFGSASTLAIARRDGVPENRLVSYSPGDTAKVGAFRIEQFASRAATTPTGGAERSRSAGSGGSSSDVLIRKGSHSILIKPSASFIPGALHHVNAEVVFLATDGLAEQDTFFQDLYYQQTIGELRPELVIPVRWDDVAQPLSRSLVPAGDTPAAFDLLIHRLRADKIRFGLLQGYQTAELFSVRSCATPVLSQY